MLGAGVAAAAEPAVPNAAAPVSTTLAATIVAFDKIEPIGSSHFRTVTHSDARPSARRLLPTTAPPSTPTNERRPNPIAASAPDNGRNGGTGVASAALDSKISPNRRVDFARTGKKLDPGLAIASGTNCAGTTTFREVDPVGLAAARNCTRAYRGGACQEGSGSRSRHPRRGESQEPQRLVQQPELVTGRVRPARVGPAPGRRVAGPGGTKTFRSSAPVQVLDVAGQPLDRVRL
jgi:hypothetical protein